MICRLCGSKTHIPKTSYPEPGGIINRRAVRRVRACLNPVCGFRESTLEVPEHRVIVDPEPPALKPKKAKTPRAPRTVSSPVG